MFSEFNVKTLLKRFSEMSLEYSLDKYGWKPCGGSGQHSVARGDHCVEFVVMGATLVMNFITFLFALFLRMKKYITWIPLKIPLILKIFFNL